jgi:hypothetical protein
MPDSQRRGLGAAVLAALGGVLGVVTVTLSLASAGLPGPRDAAALDEFLSVLGLLPSLAFCAVGGVIATRRHGNRIGWLCLAIGLLFVVVMTFGAAGLLAAKRGAPAEVVGRLWWPAALWAPALGLLGTHLALRLPDGTLRSPRWRPFSWLCTAAVGLFTVVAATEPTTYAPQSVDVAPNPLALPALAPLVPIAYGLVVVCCLGALASLVLRYRSADPQRLMQIRWIAFGAAIAIASVPLITVDAVLPTPLSQALVAARFVATFLSLTAIPVTIGVAVLRYRLYDIDRVISRTLSYAVLTVLLAGAYGVAVTVLGSLLSPLTGSSQLAVAGSTLAIAALFGPARSRVQVAVDRRFNRARYDAGKVVEAFAVRLREEVDLDELSGALLAAVRDTVQPARVFLWLR